MNTLKRLFLPAVAAVLCFCMGCETNELLKLVPLEPADISVEKLIQRLTEATDPQMEYHNCKSYLMKQELSVVKAGVKDVMATEVRFQAPDKMRIKVEDFTSVSSYATQPRVTLKLRVAGKPGKLIAVPEKSIVCRMACRSS